MNLKHEKRYEEEKKKKYDEESKMAASLDANGQVMSATAKPQIYHAIKYLADYFVRLIPSAVCPRCNNQLMTDLRQGVENQEMMPERAFCGHWLHVRCFEEFINTPPFKQICPVAGCGKFLASDQFPIDATHVKQREKKWLQLQQKAGEMDDVERLFGE